jgi:hypothetical protein
LASWREPFARRLSLVALLLLFPWFITMQESRYLIHFCAISAAFAVLGWQFVISHTGQRGKILCATVVAISLAYGMFMISKSELPGLHAVFSPRFARQWRQNNVPYVESFDFLNRSPEVTRLLILDRSVLPYYSDKGYIKPLGQWGEQVYPDVATPAQILQKLAELHVSHVLDVQSTVSGFCVPANYPGLQLVFEGPGQRVYKVLRQG